MSEPPNREWRATSPAEFATVLARGYEVRNVEFKGPGPRTDVNLMAKVIRAVLGMSNLRDGGRVVIGVEERKGTLTPSGLTPSDIATWQYDLVSAAVAEYADPYARFDLEQVPYQGGTSIFLHVYEFDQISILCRRDLTVKMNGKDKMVLRKSALYVRSMCGAATSPKRLRCGHRKRCGR